MALAGELGLRYAPVGGLTLAGRAGQQALLLLPARGRAPPGPLQSHLSTSIGDAWQRRRRGRRGQAPPGKGLICARARFERCAARPHLPAPFDAPPLRMAAPACASSRYGRESAHGRGLICIGMLQRARHALGSRSVPNQHSRPVARRSAGPSHVRGAPPRTAPGAGTHGGAARTRVLRRTARCSCAQRRPGLPSAPPRAPAAPRSPTQRRHMDRQSRHAQGVDAAARQQAQQQGA